MQICDDVPLSISEKPWTETIVQVYIVESFCAALPHPKDEVASYIAGSDQINSTTCSASVLFHLRGVT
jgi:hypothetical protein